MKKITITKDPVQASNHRLRTFFLLTPEEKMKELCHLIELSILVGGGKMKEPNRMGLVISKKNYNLPID